jgi:succinate-semialdehyde dehydrogenase/glutarate-semialdehyde dehydrogenase
VAAAAGAQHDWALAHPRERAGALRTVAEDLRSLARPLGDLVCAESGKRLQEAVAEVEFAARYFDWFADAAEGLQPVDHQAADGRRFLVERKPLGVVAAVSPWNFPLSIPARKLAAALAAGCGAVQKPSEVAPLSSLVLTVLCEARLPRGLVAAVLGAGADVTDALVDHPDVRAVSFTGSTAVGRLVAERCARTFTHAVLELGGRAPFIVCDDADLDTTLSALLVAKLRNNGESCLAANNLFIHESRYGEVLAALRERLSGLTIGDPRDPASDLGPLVSERAVERLGRLVDGAETSGSRVSRFGSVPPKGSYAGVALVEHPLPTDEVWSTEVFGPVLGVASFADEADVVHEVNSWRTGLGGYVMSSDPDHQVVLAGALDVGIVGINNGAPNTPEVPFGGRGESGRGREGGLSGLHEFTAEQTLSIAR